MSKRLKPSRLLPLALIGVAGLISLAVIPGTARAATTEADTSHTAKDDATHKNLPTEPKVITSGGAAVSGGTNDSHTSVSIVGSGRENYYVPQSSDTTDQSKVLNGEYLYQQGCSTCHGAKGEGSEGVPSLQGVGAAAVDFFVGSGRMPAVNLLKQAPRKTPIYTQNQIDAIAAYVSTNFGGGPAVPKVDLETADLVAGNKLYASNCAQCHNSAGSGGALGQGYNAPRLYNATPTEVAEAIRVGPSAMPQWDEAAFTDQQVNDIVKYVEHLGTESPGGLPLGKTGPVPEGYFAWFIGLGAMLALARWIGTRV